MRVVVLDSYDLSLLDRSQGPDHPLRQISNRIMSVNPNSNKHDPSGLKGFDRRFVEFGGGLSEEQVEWLRGQLREAKEAGQRVVVAGHVPFW